ncbi:helix-turn-helix domain-containing protein [Leptospira kmetyi]|uniref:helix-turn-helix domain-containing protein n=1 Tax=Leptospira kmetyi TaxID=408139 RepID=UPI00108426A1|nr:helix-turn-helix domain-containing protein [Leptospira kmetyi]TGL65998.1 DNA-binding protein [Leptospira kmetyi]
MSVINGNTRKGSLFKNDSLLKSELKDSVPGKSEALEIQESSKTLKTKEAAQYLNLSVRTFNQYVIDHEIPYIEWSPRVRRFLIGDLEKVALSRRTKKQIH